MQDPLLGTRWIPGYIFTGGADFCSNSTSSNRVGSKIRLISEGICKRFARNLGETTHGSLARSLSETLTFAESKAFLTVANERRRSCRAVTRGEKATTVTKRSVAGCIVHLNLWCLLRKTSALYMRFSLARLISMASDWMQVFGSVAANNRCSLVRSSQERYARIRLTNIPMHRL